MAKWGFRKPTKVVLYPVRLLMEVHKVGEGRCVFEVLIHEPGKGEKRVV